LIGYYMSGEEGAMGADHGINALLLHYYDPVLQ
jgi:hypothetical protein